MLVQVMTSIQASETGWHFIVRQFIYMIG